MAKKEKELKKYRVTTTLQISVSTVVEATSEEGAREMAAERSVQGLCHECAGSTHEDVEWRTSGELDGEPDVDNFDVEEIV